MSAPVSVWSTSTRKTCDLEDLLATVDAACYTAKEQGRNRVFVGQVDTRKINLRVEELNQTSVFVMHCVTIVWNFLSAHC